MVKDWSAVYKNSPAGTDNLSQGDDSIRDLKYAIEERMQSEHEFGAGNAGTEGGHKAGSARCYYVTARATVPTTVGDASLQQGRLRVVNEGAGANGLQFTDSISGVPVWTPFDTALGNWTVEGNLTVAGDADFTGMLTADDAEFGGEVVIDGPTHGGSIQIGASGTRITELVIS